MQNAKTDSDHDISRRQFLKDSTAGYFGAALSEVAALRVLGKVVADEHPAVGGAGNRLRLWYMEPAEDWNDALPVGNGRLGAMVFGGTDQERLQINEQTLWAGGPHDYDNPNAKKHLARLRELIFKGKVPEADWLAKKMLGVPPCQQAYQPFCNLRLVFPDHTDIQQYIRELDLDQAVTRVEYKVGDTLFRRSVFSSYPDQVLVVHLTCDRPGRLTFEVSLTSPQPNWQVALSGKDVLRLSGQLGARKPPPRNFVAPWNAPGLKLEGRLHVRATGGDIAYRNHSLQVRRANSATLVFAAGTSYIDYNNINGDPAVPVEKQLAAAAGKSFDDLLGSHVADYQKLFRRVTLEVGSNPPNKQPTNVRIRNYAPGNDLQLLELYFQFGRYLMLSSSRPGGLPANLQGIWNKDLWPAWGSKWTTNINLEMNYWPVEVCNLAECHYPLFDLISSLQEPGRKTAEVEYGCGGFVLHHNTDLWRATAPCDGTWGVWPMGAVWLSTHLYQHYEFNGDLSFLRERAYPVMKNAAQFVLDYLVEAPPGTAFPGKLVTNPSFSPENVYFLPDGSKCSLSYACTMDLALIHQLFTECISASRFLGVDGDFRARLESTLRRMPPLQVGKRGQLQEWIVDYGEPAPHQRHCSNLYGLFPGNMITLEGTPKFAAAARKSLALRGDGSSGWSRAWRACLWARLYDGERANDALTGLISRKTLPSMLNLGGPFQVDGNLGGIAAIAEILLQSHSGEVHLLPALPSAWPEGNVRGLCARGGFEVGIAWKNRKLKTATILSKLGKPCQLRYGKKVISFKTQAGARYRLNGHLERLI